jgi:Zn-dependent peptidase ImmA (M78 family)
MNSDTDLLIEALTEEYKRLADELILKYQKNYAFPPLNAVNLATDILKIKVKEDSINSSGYALKHKDEALIVLNNKDNLFRKNYTCAHEIAHMFFSEILERINKENLEYKPEDYIQTVFKRNEKMSPIEKLCDSFAANLLLPSKFLGMYAQDIEDNFSFKVFEEMARSFNVNLTPLFIKINEYGLIKNPNRFIIKFSEQKGKKGREEKLRVGMRVFPEKSNFFIPSDVGADTLGLDGISNWIILNPSETTSATENISLRFKDPLTQKWQSNNKNISCNVQYKCYGTEKYNYTIGLFEMANHF